MAGRKREHLSEAIHQKLSTILVREASDPRFRSITITGVSLAKDLSTARVTYSCFEPKIDLADLTASLNGAAGFLGRALSRTLAARRTPRLHFFYDPGFDYALEVDLLLARAETGEKPGEE